MDEHAWHLRGHHGGRDPQACATPSTKEEPHDSLGRGEHRRGRLAPHSGGLSIASAARVHGSLCLS